MKPKQERARVTLSLLVLVGLLGLSVFAMAGDLEPPAAPAPTMKTLDEVEPRIPIPASATPVAEFVIDNPGSYYLAGDRNASMNGIRVNADNVTIDLMGYSLIGSGSPMAWGIYVNGRTNVEIRNGTVRDFGDDGIYENNSNGKEHRIINIRAVSNGIRGIYLAGNGHLVKNCTAADNTGHGIFATGNGSTITGNTAYNNQGYGISVGNGSTVTGNTVFSNQSTGIIASSGSTVTGNTVSSNNQSNFASYAGIWVYADCLVKGNTLDGNLQNNIYVFSSGNAIEENLVTDCVPGNGIYFYVGGNFYANNRAAGNTTNYGGTLPSGGGDGGGNASF